MAKALQPALLLAAKGAHTEPRNAALARERALRVARRGARGGPTVLEMLSAMRLLSAVVEEPATRGGSRSH